MGSKSRIAKYIVPIIQDYIDRSGFDAYVEPFCGGCNVIDKVVCKNRYANDKNHYLIELYKHVNEITKLPPYITKEHYDDVRCSYRTNNRKYDDWYIGAIGFLASYNGRFFDGGYAGVVKTRSGQIRNYYDESKRNIMSQIDKLNPIVFSCMDYQEFQIHNAVIYCDPPYEGTKQYGISKNFDHAKFWDWVRHVSKTNIVIISEMSAPEDFDCIWEQSVTRTIDNNKRVSGIEKLFIYKKGVHI